MIGGEIGYKQLTCSSVANDYCQPRFGRLNMALGYGAWCPETQDQNQYLQVQRELQYRIRNVIRSAERYDQVKIKPTES